MDDLQDLTRFWVCYQPSQTQITKYSFVIAHVSLGMVEQMVSSSAQDRSYKYSHRWTMGSNNAILLYRSTEIGTDPILVKIPLPSEAEIQQDAYSEVKLQKRAADFEREVDSSQRLL
jgi:hypothetical protein